MFARALSVHVKILTLSWEFANPPERDSTNRKIKPLDVEDANTNPGSRRRTGADSQETMRLAICKD